tara:strand:+ start:973 stop:1527 length:555 start_codon:yes stop_codon:yes gene_type:complete
MNSGEMAMFGLIRKKPTSLVKYEGQKPVKLTRKEAKKQALAKQRRECDKQSLESKIEYIAREIIGKAEAAEVIYDQMKINKKDLDRIQTFISERKYLTCADIATEHRWSKAVEYFNEAEHRYWHNNPRAGRESNDQCARAVYAIEVQLRKELKEYKRLEKECKTLTQKQIANQEELQNLLNSSF